MASNQITIRLPDGSTRDVATGTTAGDLAADIGRNLRKAAVIANVNGVERDLVWPLDDGDEVAIVTDHDERGLYTLRHSTAHVLAQAVLDLFPGATFGIGPPIEDGFYYDFDLPEGRTFTPDDLERIDARMREIISGKADDPTSGTDAGLVRVYDNPPRFCDVCRGPHVPHTGRLGHFKLTRVAGAYWRGDERNPMLQRIYGTAWESEAALNEHLLRLEEAEKRDHRRLGVELDLLHFPPEIGGGL